MATWALRGTGSPDGVSSSLPFTPHFFLRALRVLRGDFNSRIQPSALNLQLFSFQFFITVSSSAAARLSSYAFLFTYFVICD
jgi:hypothetical protein